jgi:ABC-type amino acid transport substrate-binding protein
MNKYLLTTLAAISIIISIFTLSSCETAREKWAKQQSDKIVIDKDDQLYELLPDTIKTNKKLIVSYISNEQVYSYNQAEGQDPVGLAIDMVDLISGSFGVTPVYQPCEDFSECNQSDIYIGPFVESELIKDTSKSYGCKELTDDLFNDESPFYKVQILDGENILKFEDEQCHADIPEKLDQTAAAFEYSFIISSANYDLKTDEEKVDADAQKLAVAVTDNINKHIESGQYLKILTKWGASNFAIRGTGPLQINKRMY